MPTAEAAARAALRTVGASEEEVARVLAELPGIRAGLDRLRPVAETAKAADFPVLLAAGRRPSSFDGGPDAAGEGPADPVAAVEAALERAEAAARFNPFIEIFAEGAVAAARRLAATASPPKPLHGVPFAYKDAFVAPNRAPTVGVGAGYRWRAGRPSTSLRRLAQAGAVAIGATNLDPHCYSVLGLNPTFGRTLNPRDPRYAVGGSSSGSAAAVAAGVVPFALGTDTGGSARIPAALCGIYGLKPTHGRIADRGMAPLGSSQDTVGILAATPAMAARVFETLRLGERRRRGGATDGARRVGLPGLRIGVDRDGLAAGMDADVAAVFETTLRVLEAGGAAVVEVLFPPLADLNLAASVLTGYEAARLHGERLAARPELYPANIRQRLLVAAAIGRADHALAERLRSAYLRTVLDGAFAAADVLLSPTIRVRAPRVDRLRDDDTDAIGRLTAEFLRLNRPFNLLGLPALSIPAGRDRNGMPVGVQIVGRPYADEAVLTLAERLSAIAAR